jgi:hypothetical protein
MINVIIVAVIVCSALWVYLDATKNKIGKIPDLKGTFNMSAGAWAIATMFLWIIGFPAYLIKRSSLIVCAKEHPVEITTRGGKFAALAVVGAAWIGVFLAAHMAGSLPDCDSKEVVALTEKVIRDAPLIKLSGLQVKGISIPAERSYDASRESRLCRAMLSHALGEEGIQYTVEWHDKNKGLIWVQLVAQ